MNDDSIRRAAAGKQLPADNLVLLNSVRPNITNLILKQYPALTESSLVSRDIVNDARLEYVRTLLTGQLGELTTLDEQVIKSLHEHEIVSEVSDDNEETENSTFGERLSDKIAAFGGSWTFILSFAGSVWKTKLRNSRCGALPGERDCPW